MKFMIDIIDPSLVQGYINWTRIDIGKHQVQQSTAKDNKNLLEMLRRGAVNISMFSNSTMLVGWCRPKRRLRRRRGTTVRLGNKRRGFSLGARPVVQWGFMAGPIRMLRKIITEMVPNVQLIEGVYSSLPFLRPQVFPLCWLQTAISLAGFSVFFFPLKMCNKGFQESFWLNRDCTFVITTVQDN